MRSFIEPEQKILLDVVFCVDGTKSMENKFSHAFLYEIMGLNETNPNQDQQFILLNSESFRNAEKRYRVIVFRDYLDSGSANPIEMSGVFDTTRKLKDFMDSIQFVGGGDEPENSLEAIFEAIRSNQWISMPDKENYRQVIIVLTDSVPCDFSIRRRRKKGYPAAGMPQSLMKLKKIWYTTDLDSFPGFIPECARLIIIGPHVRDKKHDGLIDWLSIASWDRTWFVPVSFASGRFDHYKTDFEEARQLIRSSYPKQPAGEKEDG